MNTITLNQLKELNDILMSINCNIKDKYINIHDGLNLYNEALNLLKIQNQYIKNNDFAIIFTCDLYSENLNELCKLSIETNKKYTKLQLLKFIVAYRCSFMSIESLKEFIGYYIQ